MIFVTARGPSPSIDLYIDRCERLLNDLQAIRSGVGPTAGDLASAPVIDFYQKSYVPVPCLVGLVRGHPGLPDGLTRTSDIWVAAQEEGWVRTLSRFYKLGLPPGQGAISGKSTVEGPDK